MDSGILKGLKEKKFIRVGQVTMQKIIRLARFHKFETPATPFAQNFFNIYNPPSFVRCFSATPVRSSDLISEALEEVLEEEKAQERIKEGKETPEGVPVKKDFATAKRRNAQGNRWRFRAIINDIRGLPYEVNTHSF